MIEPLQAEHLQRTVRELPALPQAVLEVLQVLRDDTLSADRCIHLIEQDQALAVRTLRLANSAFYGVPGRVTRIADAVTMLGLRTLSGVLAAATMTQVLPARLGPAFALTAHWRHAMATALTARLLAPRVGLDPEQAFLTGLMHDFGRVVLAAYYPQASAAARAQALASHQPEYQAEHQLLGLDHAAVGAVLARHWHFPGAMIEAIASHHLPWPADSAGSSPAALDLAGLIHLCDALAHDPELAGDAEDARPATLARDWLQRQLPELVLPQLFTDVATGVEDMCAALGL